MPAPVYSSRDYLQQFLRLLPRGRVWHRGWGLMQQQFLLLLMPTWVRLHVRLNDLIPQIFPCSTTELLPEWEDTLGLPDPCTGPLGTLQQRQAAVCAKFVARGGQSKEYFIAVAKALGFDISITEFAPFRVGLNRAGEPLYGLDWAFTWRVVVADFTVVNFVTGGSSAGEPLRAWANRLLECVLNSIKPAHTILEFAYGGAPPIPTGDWDTRQSTWDQTVAGGPSRWDVGV